MANRCLHETAQKAELCTSVYDVASQRHLRSVYQNELMMPRHKLSIAGGVAAPSVWNSLADYLRHLALFLN